MLQDRNGSRFDGSADLFRIEVAAARSDTAAGILNSQINLPVFHFSARFESVRLWHGINSLISGMRRNHSPRRPLQVSLNSDCAALTEEERLRYVEWREIVFYRPGDFI